MRLVALALVAALAVGCGSVGGVQPAESVARAAASPDRKVVRTGELVVSVASVEEKAPEVEAILEGADGLVVRSTKTEDSTRWVCRVPAARLDEVMDALAALGEVESRSVSAEDVTDRYADLETRLRNNRALRDRLQALLERAKDVEDVLAIEKELNRIQSEIESQQARLDRLDTAVELSTLSIRLRRERILGPLGYLGYGLWWAFSKLFVIR